MNTPNRRGHTSSSSSSSSSSSTSSAFTSPVLANSSFFSLDYFAQPNTPQPFIPAIIKNTTHSRLVQVASYTDNPIMSFPSVHPFIYTTITTPNSPNMTTTTTTPNSSDSLNSPTTPSASSISGSDYYGIGLAAMTASPEPGPSPSSGPIQARVLGSPNSDSTDPVPTPDPTITADGSKSKLAVQVATVQFPQPIVINYARPFRGQQQHQQHQQQQEVPSVPSSTPSVPSPPSAELSPAPDFGVPESESFMLPTPDMVLLGSSTQRRRRFGHPMASPARTPTLDEPASHSPTSTFSSDVSSYGPITPHETPELEQDTTVVPDVPTWRSGTPVTEGKGLGIDKVQQGLSGMTVINPLSTPSQSKPESEDDDATPKASDLTPKASVITPKAIDTRRQAFFHLIPAHENDERRHVNDTVDDDDQDQGQTPKYRHRDSAFVATAMILESFEDEDEVEAPPACPAHVKELTSSSTTSSLSGNMSNAFEYTSMLSSESMASLDSAADVRELRQNLAEKFTEMCQQNRPVGHVSTPSITSSIEVSTAPSSRAVSGSGSASGTASANGSKIKRKAVPVFVDLEADGHQLTQRDAELEMSSAQRAFYGIRSAAQSVPVLKHTAQPMSRTLPGSGSSNSLSSILTSSSSSESGSQLRTPLSISAPVLISSTSALVSSTSSSTISGLIPVKHVPREFHVNIPVPDSTPAPFGGGKRGDSNGVVYMTRREAAEMREQEEKDKAARAAGATIRRKLGKMFRSVS